MSRYWKCPNCGAVLDKGEDHAAKAAIYLSPVAETAGTVACSECGSSCSAKAVYSGEHDVWDPPVVERPEDVACANCKKAFPWDHAYNQQDTPGSHAYNPAGHGDWRPRAFCPHCGFLVAEWDIDPYADRNRWRWHAANAGANEGKPLPPSAGSYWGRTVPIPARPITEEVFLDIPRVQEFLEERERKESEKAEEIPPCDLEGRCKKGFLYLEDNELDEAISEFKGCLTQDDHARAHRGLGWAYYLARHRGKPEATLDAALSHLRAAMRLDPGDGEAHFCRGIIHHDEHRDAEAISEFEKALELRMSTGMEAAARSSLGQKYISRGQLLEAVDQFERAEALNPTLFPPHAHLRIIYEVWGEHEKAEEERRQAERTCGGTALIPSLQAQIRQLASSARRPSVTPPPERQSASSASTALVTPPSHPKPSRPKVICPKCQAQNHPDRASCSQCGANLLPGRSALERVGFFFGGIVGAAIFIGLGVLFAGWEEVPPCCASPAALGLFALSCLVGGFRWAFGRTKEYEKYLKRAERHVEAAPDQALADFTTALQLAPEKQKAQILKQRGELHSKLGDKEEALEDLSAYAVHPQAHKGAKVMSEMVGVDLEQAAGGATERRIDGLRSVLVQEGALQAVGYCKHCKDAVLLDENRGCSRCGVQVKKARFVKPEETEAELAKLREEAAARRNRRRTGLIVGGVILFVLAVCAGVSIWSGRMRKTTKEATPAAAVTAAPTTFAENIFSFEYPSNWELITEAHIPVLLETSLKGLKTGSYDYVGGVYIGGVEDRRGCAKIVVVVFRDPSLPGTLTDEHYQRVKAVTEKEMGSRLIRHRKIEVSSMPAAESVHIGKSRVTKLWDLIVVPPEPGIAYMVSCCSHKDSYDDFEPVFEQAIGTLKIRMATPATPTPSPTAISTPTQTPKPGPTVLHTPSAVVTSYTVKAGDTLAKIAAQFGVTVEQIAEANGIEDTNLIGVDQVLVIPQP